MDKDKSTPLDADIGSVMSNPVDGGGDGMIAPDAPSAPNASPPAHPDIIHADDAAMDEPAKDAAVVDTNAQNFMQDVIEASQGDRLVLLEFWAPWCGPCKDLMPMLEDLARNSEGRVKLAKLNIDENAAIAQQLQVQSVPTVFAFKDGQPVDGFVGALPKSDLEKFISKHVTLPEADKTEAQLAEAASLLKQAEAKQAEELYLDILRRQPRSPQALAGLALCYLAQNDIAQAKDVLDMVADSDQALAEVAQARAQLALAQAPAPTNDITKLENQVKAEPKDLAVRFDLALAYHKAQQAEAAIGALLEILRIDASWRDKAAHKQLLQFFDAYGADHPAVQAGRKDLSSLLFR